MSCSVAENAPAALELLRSAADDGKPYAVALLDERMPGTGGYELARSIRAQPTLATTLLILLASSAGQPPPAGEPVLLDRHLTKPVRQSRLCAEIRELVAGDGSVHARVQPPERPDARGALHDASPEVLVVEDTPVNQLVAVRMLEKSGYRARVADNGGPALEALAERAYAAVLMDCQMPELDGYQTTRIIRREEQGSQRHIPIIAMTANSMRGERERCLAAGMDDYLTKPLRSQTLTDTLRRWITDPPKSASTSKAAAAPRQTDQLPCPQKL